MALEEMKISGYRGFRTQQTVEFAIPNGSAGSGLSVITGPNNSGKSTIIESIQARAGQYGRPVSFSVGTRNVETDAVEILYKTGGKVESIRSEKKGSSEVERDNIDDKPQIFSLPSRRAFTPYFGRGEMDRQGYIHSIGLPPIRMTQLQNFAARLFIINRNPGKFNTLLKQVLGYMPEWSIDLSDQGQYFLKFYAGKHSHSSDGLGEGIVSLFAIIDSLYDSKSDDVIVIDEPELSLHPSLQRRLLTLFEEYAKDRQIVISTHSPYFVDIEALGNGANLIRVVNEGDGIKIFNLSSESKSFIKKLAQDNLYNPHVFGLNARELFFLEDQIIIVEGQEDVLLYPSVSEQIGEKLQGSFFGWGAGGAGNIAMICNILRDLGFKRVVGLLDGNKSEFLHDLRENFDMYHFEVIPTEDIRTKPARKATASVVGLLDENKKIRAEFKEPILKLLQSINTYFGKSP